MSIVFDKVGFKFPSATHYALRKVSLEFSPCERVCVIGSNGSGKTTLARLSNALLTPCEGSVAVDKLTTENNNELVRQIRTLVGMVFQDPEEQILNVRVFDEVAFGPCNLGLNKDDVTHRVEEALSLVGMSDCVHRNVEELSGGQRQRIAIAGVLAMKPKYLVCDEIASMLDSSARYEISKILDDLKNVGTGIVQITHEFKDVLASDRVVLLSNGEVIWDGSSAAFARNEELIEVSGVCVNPFERMKLDLIASGVPIELTMSPQELARYENGGDF